MNFLESLKDHNNFSNLVVSFVLFLVLLSIRLIVLRAISRWHWSSNEDQRKWIVGIRNSTFLILLLGLIIIWATELRALALSLAAIAVALVLATKEILLCISGGILRASSRSFAVGDRIEIQGLRGDVIDSNLFSTTLLEVGPGQLSHQYTGRSVSFPNMMLLTHPITNETYTDDFVVHPFNVPMGMSDRWKLAESILLRIAREECQSFLEDAQRHMDRIAKTRGLETPSADPRVTVHIPEPHRIDLLVRIPTPARKKGRIEQAILRRFLEEFSV